MKYKIHFGLISLCLFTAGANARIEPRPMVCSGTPGSLVYVDGKFNGVHLGEKAFVIYAAEKDGAFELVDPAEVGTEPRDPESFREVLILTPQDLARALSGREFEITITTDQSQTEVTCRRTAFPSHEPS